LVVVPSTANNYLRTLYDLKCQGFDPLSPNNTDPGGGNNNGTNGNNTNNNNTTNNPPVSEESQVNITGIVVGILVPLILIGAGVGGYFWYKKRK